MSKLKQLLREAEVIMESLEAEIENDFLTESIDEWTKRKETILFDLDTDQDGNEIFG